MKFKHSVLFGGLVIIAAWLFDYLFWMQQPGVSVSVYIGSLLGLGLWLTWSAGYRTPWQSMVLLIPILLFALAIGTRLEPLTLFMSYILLLSLMAGLALTLRSGLWLHYSLLDWVVGVFRLLWGASTGGILLREQMPQTGRDNDISSHEKTAVKKTQLQVGRPVAFGILLALPVVLLFGWLLGMADPVFARLLNEWIGIERWPEYVWRGFYIMLWAYLLAGIYLFMLVKSNDQKLIGMDGNKSHKLLGGIEATTVLASVNLLFAIFVAVQFHYFFGGQNNIHLEGFTYSEYARRGFFELVLVAVMSLMLFLGLGAFSNRSSSMQQRIFSGLGIVLVGLIGIMLYSAFLRLTMYEMAYGFSRLRTYTHVFMVWLGILLAATAILEVLHRPRMFALALLLVAIGFGASLGFLNVDAFIAYQNIARANQGYELDVAYLTQLSDDAVPAMSELFSGEHNKEIRAAIGAALTCKIHQAKTQETDDWRSFHVSRNNARIEFKRLETQLSQYRLNKDLWIVEYDQQEFQCYQEHW
jgi:hypothetical protein